MTQELTIIAPLKISEEQSNAWLGMAQEKNNVAATLGTMELQAQAILLPLIGSEDYAGIDAALAEYRKLHTSITESRKPFTNAVDSGIVQPLMAFEKRVDPKVNTTYMELSNKSLSLRQIEAQKVTVQNAKNAEIATFKAHVSNEFSRTVFEYKNQIRKEINTHYSICLRGKDRGDMEQTKKFLLEMPTPLVNKFSAKYLSNEELQEIYMDVNKPNFLDIFNSLMEEMEEKFINFESDVANAEAAIAHQESQAALLEVTEKKELQETVAIDTLIATSEAVVIETPKIKNTLQIIVVESEGWAKSVMAAFITHLPQLAKYIRVKSWSKLSIGQMAEYLSKLASDEGLKYNNIQLLEIQK